MNNKYTETKKKEIEDIISKIYENKINIDELNNTQKDELIGNPKEITIKELAQLVKEITGSKSNIKFCEANQDDPPRRKPSINKAIKEIEWTPKIELEYGLEKRIEYYSNQNKSIN